MSHGVNAFLKFAKTIKPGWRADLLFSILFYPLWLIAPRRNVAKRNIALVFPDKTPEEQREILTESYRSMVWTGIEMLSWYSDPSLVDKWTLEVEGREHIDNALAAGKGAIIISAHVGNWEHSAAWAGKNYGCVGIARHPDSPFQKELINRLRTNAGLRVLGKDEPMTRALGVLKKNGVLGLLSDQHGGGEGIPAPLFGQTTSTVTGAAVFAWLTGAPLIPFQSLRVEPFKFKIILGSPIEWSKGPDRNSTIRDLTGLVNKEIEKMIRRAPGQWLWQHKRFKEIFLD